ncbi:hypothetical protein REPUB_Repub15cG0082600 [Reevesia pubescens]
MENLITSKCCNNQPWFVLLVFSVFIFELLCFDYSAITGRKSGVPVLDNNHENAISTQNSISHDFTEIGNDSISPLPNSPPANFVVNRTDKANKKAVREEELKMETEDNEIFQWQDRMRRQKQHYLFTFASAPRPEYKDSIWGKIIDQCLASKNQFKLLDCNYGATNYDNPVNVMRVFQSSIFCLQPPGDSYTRRSIFDSILAGCILVFFHPGTAYAQYTWHLPKNYTKYLVYIPVKDLSEWKIILNKTLLGISVDRISALREEVISLIPRVVYADPRSRLETLEDAFNLAIKGILERIESVRNMIREEKDPSVGFADGDDYKYTFSPYGNGI